jgi:hypothetical protein
VSPGPLRREYGSHGSIDMLGDGPSPNNGSFFALLQDYKHKAPPDQRSPGPAKIADVLRGRVEQSQLEAAPASLTNGNVSLPGISNAVDAEPDAASPKVGQSLVHVAFC